MQRHVPPTQTLAARVRTLAGSLAVLLIGTAFYVQSAKAQSVSPTGPIPATASYACDFEGNYCDFYEQSKVAPTARRSTLIGAAASGVRGVQLTTLPGDSNVNGSGTWERNDLSKPADGSYCNAGQEEWWAFSIMFPDGYVFPPGPEAGIIMDFHHSASSGQANYEIQTIPGIGLRARGYGGASVNTGKYDALIPDPYGAPTGKVTKNVWYHFVLHVRWSSNGDGLMEGWLNGRKYQSYQGPTLYAGIGCYLKLANYHAPFGQSSSIIHDRVARGRTAADVTLVALEGVPGTGTPPPSTQPAASYALSTVTMGSGSGAVTSSPAAINCGSTCSSTFASGTSVTLNASPASGSSFAGWSGACAGTGACTVSMTSAKSVTATFTAEAAASGSLVPHFYRTILRREPDSGGQAYWEAERARMTSIGADASEVWFAMASIFFSSAEYAALRRDDAGFVRDLYNSFLDRSADASGISFWAGQLAQGMPREVLVTSFMFSPEFAAKVGGAAKSARVEVDIVLDFYRGLLARLPDSGGFSYWLTQFRTAQCRGADAVNAQAELISSSFANSAEASARGRTNAQYVSDLYNAFLRRGGDLGGVQYWIQQLDRGAMTREAVRRAFLASPEFSAKVRELVAAGCAG
jgi:hypothetical protein